MRRAVRVLSLTCLTIAALTACSPEPIAPSTPAGAPFELEELTIRELQDALAAGRYTSRRLVELYLERIEAIDRGGPGLRSIIETNPDALAIAVTHAHHRNARTPLVRS